MNSRRIEFKERINEETGEITPITPCPFIHGLRVSSWDCCRCKYFVALYQDQTLECRNTAAAQAQPAKQLDLFSAGLGAFPQTY